MALEKNISGIYDEFESSGAQYEDIENIRSLEDEAARTDNGKIGVAGLMALAAGVGLLAVSLMENIISMDILEALHGGLLAIGLGATIYGTIKVLRKVLGKTLDIPSLNVIKKNIASTAQKTGSYAQYQKRSSTAQESAQTATQFPFTQQQKTLRRSRTNRVISGVAGGIGEHLGISPALIRFAFIVGTFASSGLFVFAYLLLTLILPKNYDDWSNMRRKR